MNLKDLAKQTSHTSQMQRYYLSCIAEFGEDLEKFVEELCQVAYEKGDNTGQDWETP